MTITVKNYYLKREVVCDCCFSQLEYSHEDVQYSPTFSDLLTTEPSYHYIQCPVCHTNIYVKKARKESQK